MLPQTKIAWRTLEKWLKECFESYQQPSVEALSLLAIVKRWKISDNFDTFRNPIIFLDYLSSQINQGPRAKNQFRNSWLIYRGKVEFWLTRLSWYFRWYQKKYQKAIAIKIIDLPILKNRFNSWRNTEYAEFKKEWYRQ